MATDPRYQTARSDGHAHRTLEELAVAEDHEGWMARSRVFLTPIAAPSIMGLFGFTIGAMVLEHSFGRTIVPVGKWAKRANIPGGKVTDPIAYLAGMPGVRVGQ